MIYSFRNQKPTIHPETFVAPNATIVGDVTLEQGVTCWFGAVLRGDEAPIVVKTNSNIQDNAVLHCDPNAPLLIGSHVTIGHSVVLHSCEIDDYALIGMHATILSGAKIGEGAIIAAGAVVKENDIIPPFSLAAGIPAQVKKTFSPPVSPRIKLNVEEYVALIKDYSHLEPLDM